MAGNAGLQNPFPGLRPFGPDETHLFFGREPIIDQLLSRLRQTRFLCVMGPSGCGKSSLVRAGLVPSLHGGFMALAGSSWRVAMMRPGSDPIGNLAAALNHKDVLGNLQTVQDTSPVLTEVTLRRSDLGLVECVRLARLPSDDNLLIVVDQFEELFRFRRSGGRERARDEAVAFVKRLLAVMRQCDVPVFVVLTLRSEFVGECNEYPGLAEAVNVGQYLVPRMTRDQLKSAISGPILVGGGELAPRLLVRLLNDVGDDPDRLPMLQHALLRTWNYWAAHRSEGEPIDVPHYDAIGTMRHALSRHADEAYEELSTETSRKVAECVFKALTEASEGGRGVRRPATIAQLAELADASVADVAAVVDVFRDPERSFLTPAPPAPLDDGTVVDISHESLMRVWERLKRWTREESESAIVYRRLARAALRYREGTTGLWRHPELGIALKWRDENRPTEAWAVRYDPAYTEALRFLDESRAEHDRELDERRRARLRKLQWAWGVSGVLLFFAGFAWLQQQRAEREQLRAEQSYQLAVRAVDEMLSDVGLEESLADVPQTEQIRQQLLEKAQQIFERLQEGEVTDVDLRRRTATAQQRLGKIYELQGSIEGAAAAYQAAIDQFRTLSMNFRDQPRFRLDLSVAHNEFGEHLRPYDTVRAEGENDAAELLQQNLVETFPDNAEYRYELARTFNNRGILLGNQSGREGESEASFLRAIELFEGLREERDDVVDAMRLARTKNSFAVMLREHGRHDDAIQQYEGAIELMRELVSRDPERRDYREGLARMYNNLGNLHLIRDDAESALQANDEARQLFDELARPVRSLRNEIANSHNSRGTILRMLDRPADAEGAYATAVAEFERLESEVQDFAGDPGLNHRFGNALANLAILNASDGRHEAAVEGLSRAISYYNNAVNSAAPGMSYSRNLADANRLLGGSLLEMGRHSEAVAAADAILEATQDSQYRYRAALLYARASGAAARDRALPVAERQGRVAQYDQRTVEILASALAGGYPAERLAADAETRFEHLTGRADFARLLAGDGARE